MAIDQAQIDVHLADYESVTGVRKDRFVCPITLRECDQSELIDGHILNKSYFRADRRTVIQYQKVDGFYGAYAEPKAVQFLNNLDRTPAEILRRSKRLLAVFSNGTSERAFAPKPKAIKQIGMRHPVFEYEVGDDKVQICIAVSPDDPRLKLEVSIQPDEDDPTHCWTATLVKAAYLCSFHIYGYRAVFDSGGEIVRQSLSRYFADGHSSLSVRKYFDEFSSAFGIMGHSIRREQFVKDYQALQFDTMKDRAFLVHRLHDRTFAMTCIFRINGKTTFITLPQGDSNIDAVSVYHLYMRQFRHREPLDSTTHLAQFTGETVKIETKSIKTV